MKGLNGVAEDGTQPQEELTAISGGNDRKITRFD